MFGAPPPGMQFQRYCASCHTATGGASATGDRVAPSVSALAELPPARIYQAMTAGSMAAHAGDLDDKAKRDLTEFVAKRPFVDIEGTGIARMTNKCAANPRLGDLAASASWAGWGPHGTNARFQPAAAARLAPEEVPKLTLKWAFGLPGGGVTASQPTVALGRAFIASDNRVVYSLDARTGCAYWAFHAENSGRFAPIVAPIAGYPGTRYAVFFVTMPGTAHAVDAQDGKLLWKTEIKGLHAVNASATYHDGRLYVPFAGTEVFTGGLPTYECCKSRGAVAALDANTGRVLWKVDSIPEPVTQPARVLTASPSGDSPVPAYGTRRPWTRSAASSTWAPATVTARRPPTPATRFSPSAWTTGTSSGSTRSSAATRSCSAVARPTPQAASAPWRQQPLFPAVATRGPRRSG
jgi:polyvinyl alcohol dehydrogenase (cytochrome)